MSPILVGSFLPGNSPIIASAIKDRKVKSVAYSFQGTTIRNHYNGYSRVDRYRTDPKGRGCAPYLALKSRRRATSGSSSYITSQFNSASSWVQAVSTIGSEPLVGLLNSASARLRESVYESMQIASNIVEGRETGRMLKGRAGKSATGIVRTLQVSIDTIVRSANTLRTAYRQLRRGAYLPFLRTLGLSPESKRVQHLRRNWMEKKRNFRRNVKNVADHWLEYHFGWKPLVQDIFNATRLLTGEISEKHTERATARVNLQQKPLSYWIASVVGRVTVKTGARFILVNPNAFLREQAGLNNPASWLWEAIPFSFLLDWFGNINQCLSAMTDYTGLRYEDPYVTVLAFAESRDTLISPADPVDTQFAAMQMRRTLGLHGPTLRLSLPRGLSVSRGATAMSLLVQVFIKP